MHQSPQKMPPRARDRYLEPDAANDPDERRGPRAAAGKPRRGGSPRDEALRALMAQRDRPGNGRR
jgi:hypothetical protein